MDRCCIFRAAPAKREDLKNLMKFVLISILLSGALGSVNPNRELYSVYQSCPRKDLTLNWTSNRATLGDLKGQDDSVLVKLFDRNLALLNRIAYKIFKNHSELIAFISGKQALELISGDLDASILGGYLLSETDCKAMGFEPGSEKVTNDDAATIIKSNLEAWKKVGFKVTYGFIECKDKLAESIFRRAWIIAFPDEHGFSDKVKASTYEEAMFPFLCKHHEYLALVPYATFMSALEFGPKLTNFQFSQLRKVWQQEYSVNESSPSVQDVLGRHSLKQQPTIRFAPRLQLHKLLSSILIEKLFWKDNLMALRNELSLLAFSNVPRTRNNQIFRQIFSNGKEVTTSNVVPGFSDEEQLDLLEDNFYNKAKREAILSVMTADCRIVSALKILCGIRQRAPLSLFNFPRVNLLDMVPILIPKFEKNTDGLITILNEGNDGQPMFSKEERCVGWVAIAKLKMEMDAKNVGRYGSIKRLIRTCVVWPILGRCMYALIRFIFKV